MSTVKVRCIVPTTAELHDGEVYEATAWAGWYMLAKFGALLFPPHWFEVVS